jgi:hypothetical protein
MARDIFNDRGVPRAVTVASLYESIEHCLRLRLAKAAQQIVVIACVCGIRRNCLP